MTPLVVSMSALTTLAPPIEILPSAARILTLTPNVTTARRLAAVWGVHAVVIEDIDDTPEMVERASDAAIREGFAVEGDRIAIAAGMPFGTSGTTNLLRVARIPEKQKTTH